METTLYLYEQLQLLSMRDEDGKPHNYNLSQRVGYALAGAALMDLVTGGYVAFDHNKNCVVQPQSCPDAVLGAVQRRIAKPKKPKDAKYWVQVLYAYHTSSARLLGGLVAKGVIRLELRKKWKIFTLKRYPLIDFAAKQAIISRLEKVIVSAEPPEYAVLILLSLVKSARLLPYIFPDWHKNNPTGLEEDVQTALKKQPYGNFTQEAIEDAERRAEMLESLEAALDTLTIAMDAIADAVDASADAGGGDGGDGGGGDGGSH